MINAMTNNFNIASCIKEAHSIGANWYTNICTGDTVKVAWGSLDWANWFTLGTFIITMLAAASLLFVGSAYVTYKEIKEI